jgi:hypothetical protein
MVEFSEHAEPVALERSVHYGRFEGNGEIHFIR